MSSLLLAATLLLALPAHAEAPRAPDVYARTSLSLLATGSQGRSSLDVMLGEHLRLRWSDDVVRGEALFDGRIGVKAPQATMYRTRIRRLGVHLDFDRVWLDVGRIRVAGGSWRLADGAQAMVRLGKGVELGGWFGEVPDPFTTLPAARVGGGPLFRWQHQKAQVSAALELAGTAAGLDRAAVILKGRVEPVQQVEVEATVDLQDVGGVPHPADLGAMVTLTPRSDLRIRAFWNTWSSLAWNQGLSKDVALSRFEVRFGEVIPLNATAVDMSLYHQGGGDLRWRPELPGGARFVLSGEGRYRGHVDPSRQFGRATVRLGFEGLGGHFDVSTDHSAVYWGGGWRWDGGLQARVDIKADVFALDTSVRVAVGSTQPAIYADLFLDLHVGPVWVSAGYRFTNEQARDRWAAAHVGLVRVTWVARKRAERRTK